MVEVQVDHRTLGPVTNLHLGRKAARSLMHDGVEHSEVAPRRWRWARLRGWVWWRWRRSRRRWRWWGHAHDADAHVRISLILDDVRCHPNEGTLPQAQCVVPCNASKVQSAPAAAIEHVAGANGGRVVHAAQREGASWMAVLALVRWWWIWGGWRRGSWWWAGRWRWWRWGWWWRWPRRRAKGTATAVTPRALVMRLGCLAPHLAIRKVHVSVACAMDRLAAGLQRVGQLRLLCW